MSDPQSTNFNSVILLMIAGGFMYFRSTAEENTPAWDEEKNGPLVMWAVGATLFYSFRNEVTEHFERDRLYTAAAILVSQYVTAIEGSPLVLVASVLTTLLILPVLMKGSAAS